MRKHQRRQFRQQHRLRRSLLDKGTNLNDPILAQQDYKQLHNK